MVAPRVSRSPCAWAVALTSRAWPPRYGVPVWAFTGPRVSPGVIGGCSAHATHAMRHAADPNTVHNFRTKCLRELKKIKLAWPNLHYQTVKGALVLMPTHPRIQPSPLHLVE